MNSSMSISDRVIELQPVREDPADYDKIEEAIRELFRKELYQPLIAELTSKKVLKNTREDLIDAILTGRISYHLGYFTGKFNAAISRELKKLGAHWTKDGWTITQRQLPIEINSAIAESGTRFQRVLEKLDQRIAKMLPEEIAEKVKLKGLFDTSLWKIDRSFKRTVKRVSIPPVLTPERRERIAEEYTTNMKKYIKGWTKEEIVELRKSVQAHSLEGNRYEDLIDRIQKRYRVGANKAKFLARQETNLMLSKFKEVRYADIGIKEYKWRCVIGSPLDPVRLRHQALSDASKEGQLFRFDDPPITTGPGEKARRNNPREDFNCRCTAVPIVRFK